MGRKSQLSRAARWPKYLGMSSEMGAHDGGSAASGELVRVWPSLVNRGLWFVGILVGAFVVVATIANGYLFLAPLGLLLIFLTCLLYTSPSPRDGLLSRMPSSA